MPNLSFFNFFLIEKFLKIKFLIYSNICFRYINLKMMNTRVYDFDFFFPEDRFDLKRLY
jgi:hypothetical protein